MIFIPGISGSRLYALDGQQDELWPGIGANHDKLSLDKASLYYRPKVNANDVVREVGILNKNVPIYKPLLDALAQAGYVEAGTGSRQTLFVFPYDWRKSNAENASALKEFVSSRIKPLYPDSKVDILAHSMGGLLARRYIMDNPNAVGKLITIATPWLGAPKAINVLDTGEFLDGIANLNSTCKCNEW